MDDNWMVNSAVAAATLVAVALCVLTHYEGLSLTSRGLARMAGRHRRTKVIYAIALVLVLHIVEI